MLISGLVLFYQWIFLWSKAADNRRSVERPVIPRLGTGMLVTIGRGFMLVLLAGFLFTPRPGGFLAWWPAIVYTVASILDYLDGYVARVFGDVTMLGEHLDTELDAQGMLLASGLANWYGALPAWFLIIGVLRYGFQFGKWVLRRLGRQVHELPPSVSRRPVAGLTMGFLSVVLWPIFSPPETVVAGAVFSLIILASFARDWLVVSGAVDPDGHAYQRARLFLKGLFSDWIPVAARVLLPLLILPVARIHLSEFKQALAGPVGEGLPFASSLLLLFGLLEIGTLVLILSGTAARTAALVLIVPVGLTISVIEMEAIWGYRLVGILIILILGSGRYSLWEPEASRFGRRAGSQGESDA
jgi:CDP-diacylglycerol--glycerol-3-phosphate 3-phosphatidyltransferase